MLKICSSSIQNLNLSLKYRVNRLRSSKISLGHWLNRLRVGQKIGVGYGIALGVAIVGSTFGILTTNRHHNDAINRHEDILEEIQIFYRLHTNLAAVIIHEQELINALDNPAKLQKEFDEIQEHQVLVEQYWQQLVESYQEAEVEEFAQEVEMLEKLELGYTKVLKNNFNQLNALIQYFEINKNNFLISDQNKDLIINFYKNSNFEDLLEFLENLELMVTVLGEEVEDVEAIMRSSNVVKTQIITVSMILSILVAAFLSFYTSRAIIKPLQSLTNGAQQVTNESDFTFQFKIETQDEIAMLSQSFNALILKVNDLLKKQEITAKQQLIQHEKLSSLGQMIAGVAHEINNPVNFIHGNLTHIIEYTDDLLDLIHTYESEIPNPPIAVQDKAEAIERDFIEEDLPKVLQSIKLGAERTLEIAQSLKNFSRLDEIQAKPVDIQKCLESSLLILNPRIKQGIRVIKNYQNIPQIEGYLSSLSQVFINIIGNAIDAFSESPHNSQEIQIFTQCLDDERIIIRISDNGPGIPLENQQKIFESFFTTKPVNVGTGLGLAISREIVEEKHKGQLKLKSEVGIGTEFSIILPLTLSAESQSFSQNPITSKAS